MSSPIDTNQPDHIVDMHEMVTDTNQASEDTVEQTTKSLSSVLYSKGKQDEMYTPRYGVLPLLEFLPKNAKVWCPFDTLDSQFVKVLKENGISVINSHIDSGQDFYSYEPEEWDILVSNPPFTRKRQIFERALSFGKPFALLMTNTWLNDAAPKQLFYDIDLQLLMFDKRIEYSGEKKVTFSSSYYCRDLLPKQIIMRRLLR